MLFLRFQPNCNGGCPRVPSHVRQGLLRNPEQVGFHIFRQAAIQLRFAVNGNLSSLAETFRKPAQAGFQAEIIEYHGPQQLG